MAVITPYDKRSRTCPVCGKRFRSFQTLVQHMKKEHPGVFIAQDES
ncbi:MAG: C2H2-type zinc finger protein [Nitrososphaerota archaeon]|nr:C2H2-type zinc finger protein [Nitrososphaerota archaeon]